MDIAVLRATLTADYSDLARGIQHSEKVLNEFGAKEFDSPKIKSGKSVAEFKAKFKADFEELAKIAAKPIGLKIDFQDNIGKAVGKFKRDLAALDKLGQGDRAFKITVNTDTIDAIRDLSAVVDYIKQIKASSSLKISVTTTTTDNSNPADSNGGGGDSGASGGAGEGGGGFDFGELVKGVIVYKGLELAQQAFTEAVKMGVGYLSNEQSVLNGLTTQLDGSRTRAKALYSDLQSLNDQSPFEEADILPNAQKMLATKMSIDELKQGLQGINEQTSALGGDAAKFGQISTAMSQIYVKPKLQLEEITSQLIEAGVPAFDLLAKAYGTNTAQIQKWISEGVIPGKEAFKALSNQMARQNFGAAERQSRTFTGAISTLSDRLKRGLGESFRGAFTEVTRFLNMLVYVSGNKQFQDWVSRVGRAVAQGFGFVFDVFKTIVKGSFDASKAYADIWGKVLEWYVGAWRASAGFVWDTLKDAARNLAWFADVSTGLIQKALGGGNFFQDTLEGMIGSAEGLAAKGTGAIADFASNFKQSWSEIYGLGGMDLGKLWNDAGKYADGTLKGQDEGKKPAEYKPTLGTPDDDGKAAKKAAAARLKLQKDALSDAATAEEKYAAAFEKRTEKQINKLEKLRDAMRDFFSSVQEKFIALGLLNDPINEIIAQFENMLDLSGKARDLALNGVKVRNEHNENARQDRAQLERISGQDGVVNGKGANAFDAATTATSDAGAKVAAVASARFESGKYALARFKGRCEELAETAYYEAGVTAYDAVLKQKGSALQTMRRFQAAKIGQRFTPGMALAPGGLLYSDSMGRGFGHVQTIGKDGARYDQYGRNKFRESNFQWYVPPPGAPKSQPAGASAPAPAQRTERAKKLLSVDPGTLGAGRLDEILKDGFDGSLSKFAKIPATWGKAVKDSETTKVQFMAQGRLATKEFQDQLASLSAITGRTVPQIVGWFRLLMQSADFRLSKANWANEFESLQKATAKGRREMSLGVRATRSVAPMLDAPNFSGAAYERASFQANLKNNEWNKDDVAKQLEAVKGYNQEIEAQKARAATARGLGNTKGAAQLEKSVAQLRAEKGDLQKRLAAQVNERIGTATLGDDTQRLEAAKRAYAELRTQQADELSLLEFENRLLVENAQSRQAVERTLAMETVRRRALATLKAGKPNASPDEVKGFEAQAQERADAEGTKFDAKAGGERIKQTSALGNEFARNVALLKEQEKAYFKYDFGSPALARQLKKLEIENKLSAQFADKMKGGDISTLSAPDRADYNKQLEDGLSAAEAETKSQAAQAYGERLMAIKRDMAGLGDESGLAAGAFERLNGILSKLSPFRKQKLEANELNAAIAKLKQSTSEQLRQKAGSFEDGFLTSARAKVEREIRDKKAAEANRIAKGGAPLAQGYYDEQDRQGALRLKDADTEDANARLVNSLGRQKELELSIASTVGEKLAVEQRYQDLLRERLNITQSPGAAQAEASARAGEMSDARAADAKARLAAHLGRQKDLELSMVHTASERLAIEQRYQDLLRERLGYAQDPQAAADDAQGRAQEMADTRMADASARVQKHAQEMRDSIYSGLKEGFSKGAAAGMRAFGKSVYERALDQQLGAAADNLGKRFFGLGTVPKEVAAPGVAGVALPALVTPFVPAAARAPGIQSSPIARVAQSIAGAKGGGNLVSATFHIGSANQTISRATINARSATGASGGGAGTSKSGDQFLGDVLGVASIFT